MRTIALALALATTPFAAWAQSSDGEMDHSHMEMKESVEVDGDLAEAGDIHTTATIHSVGEDKVNLSHPAIEEIGWPAMTMDLPLLEDAAVGPVEEGEEATITLMKGPDGMYGISAIMPVE